MPRPVVMLMAAALMAVPGLLQATELMTPRPVYTSAVKLVVPDQPLQGRQRAIALRTWTLADIKADHEWREAVSERLRRLSP